MSKPLEKCIATDCLTSVLATASNVLRQHDREQLRWLLSCALSRVESLHNQCIEKSPQVATWCSHQLNIHFLSPALVVSPAFVADTLTRADEINS